MRSWFNMQSAGDTAEVMIYDEIGQSFWGEETLSAKDFDAQLKALGPVKNINLRINSPGGVATDGVAMYNMLRNHPATVNVKVDGIAASAASLVAMAGDTIEMPDNTFMLIHRPSTMAWGTDSDLMSAAADLEAMNKSFAATYASRSGQTPEKMMEIMTAGALMTAGDCKEMGLADSVSDPVRMTASYPLRMLPDSARVVFMAALPAEPDPVADPVVEPVTVDPVVEPAAPVVVAPAEYTGAAETVELCQLAGASLAMANAFITARTPIGEVREKLLAFRASASDDKTIVRVDPSTVHVEKDRMTEWRATQERVRTSLGIKPRR